MSRKSQKKDLKDLQGRQARLRFANGAVHRFTNMSMKGGRRNAASRILLDSLKVCKSDVSSSCLQASASKATYLSTNKASLLTQAELASTTLQTRKHWLGTRKIEKERFLQSHQICAQAIRNVEPVVETRKVRVRGSTYQVPSIPHIQRKERVAVDWIYAATKTKKRSNQPVFSICLGQELFDSLNKTSLSVSKTNEMYKLASHSRAYARYRWW